MRKIILLGSAIVIGLALLCLVLAETLIPLKRITLKDLNWQRPGGIVAVQDEAREGSHGLLMIRLKDGKEQFVNGSWRAVYTDRGDIVVIGEFPPNYSSSTGQMLYSVRGDKIIGISLGQVTGTVQYLSESPNDVYMYFRTDGTGKDAHCIMDWKKEQRPACVAIQIPGIQDVAWNPKKDNQLIVSASSGTLYLVDPWENGMAQPKAVDPADPDRPNYAALVSRPPSAPQKFRYFLNFAYAYSGGKLNLLRLPWGSTLKPLLDGGHYLVQAPDALYVFEPSTRSLAPLLVEQGVGRKAIYYRNIGSLSL